MGKIRDIAYKFKTLDIMREFDAILLELNGTITGMNKEQLSLGFDSQGQQLMPYASPEYAVLKKNHFGSEAPMGIPNLKLSGDFYKGFFIIIDSTKITISSKDIKTLELEGKYGDIFGLEPEKLGELAHSYILPRLAAAIKNKLTA